MAKTLSGPELAPASGTVKKLVIFLHGVGSNGDDLIGLAPLMKDALPDTQFVSPNGCEQYDMAPFGYQWFSLRDRSHHALQAGAMKAAPLVNAYIDQQRERFGLSDADVALVGFSQGTMMALYAGLKRPSSLAAIVGFSGMMVSAQDILSRPPICLVHGEYDEVVPFRAMEAAEQTLLQNGFSVEAHARPMLGHGIDPEGIDIANDFLKRHLG